MRTTDNSYRDTKAMMEKVRQWSNVGSGIRMRLNEEEQKRDVIAITNDPKFGQNVLQNQIDAFRQAVNPSARFSTPDEEHPEKSPLTYFPKTGNVIFSGTIPALNNLKFQFVLNSTDAAPYIFADSLTLTENTITTLNKLYGMYQNWCQQWWGSADLLGKLK